MATLGVEREFVYKFSSRDQEWELCVPVQIPPSQPAADLTGRLTFEHNLPCYIQNDLTAKLEDFLLRETREWQDDNAEAVVEAVTSGEVNVDRLAEVWHKVFTQEVREFAKPEEVTAEQRFSEVYHALIHSPALETLLNLEHSYAVTIDDLLQQRDQDLQHLEQRQQEEMKEALRNVGTSYTDEQINVLAQRHFDNMQMIETKWSSELSNQQEIQQREYREWVIKVHEDTKTANTPTYMQRVRVLSSNLPEAEEEERTAQIRMEESFTIILGAQMKTTHNLRLLCASILDLCRHKPHTVGGLPVAQPQRLQTAMSLYSNNLNGMIMLVDNRINTYSGVKRRRNESSLDYNKNNKEFAGVCEQCTDFHFPRLDQQFTVIEQHVHRAAKHRANPGDTDSQHSAGTTSSSDQQDTSVQLHTGDFYITRHSNLSEEHVVFHLVTDDSTRGDITSRHPTILSLRNIIKLCFRYDITTLTIPLLLTHTMQEEMTIPWCMKRAELVFKCVKGFMMEMATYGGQESRTIQFLVPLGISDELFASVSNMLPTIFRLSNPVYMAKATAKPSSP